MGKRMRIPVIVLAVLGLLAAAGAFAADSPPPGGPGGKARYQRIYDPATVETVTGDVLQVKKIPHRRGTGFGVHLILKTEKEEIPVHMGPSQYLEKQGIAIAEKDRVEVKASRVVLKGKAVLIAAEVRKGDAVLKLRNENGVPAWSRRKTQ